MEGAERHEENHHAGKSHRSRQQFVGMVKKQHTQRRKRIKRTMKNSGGHNGTGLYAYELNDWRKTDASYNHNEDPNNGMAGEIVSHQNQRRMPQSPDCTYDNCRKDKLFSNKLLQQIATPAYLLTEG